MSKTESAMRDCASILAASLASDLSAFTIELQTGFYHSLRLSYREIIKEKKIPYE